MMGGGKAPQMMASTFPLTRGEVVEMLSVSGPVEGTDSVEVVSNLHAEILEIPVKEGDRVEKDQLLATLDEKDAKKRLISLRMPMTLQLLHIMRNRSRLRTAMPRQSRITMPPRPITTEQMCCSSREAPPSWSWRPLPTH